ncbi:MAG: hypothetical protein ABI051_03955 [Vicinamibacterales bacterium]
MTHLAGDAQYRAYVPSIAKGKMRASPSGLYVTRGHARDGAPVRTVD